MINRRRELEREEAVLKKWFVKYMNGKTSIKVPGFVVSAILKSRTQMDRGKAVELIGEEATKAIERIISYVEVGVRPLKREKQD